MSVRSASGAMLEPMERRLMMSVAPYVMGNQSALPTYEYYNRATGQASLDTPQGSTSPSGAPLTPATMRNAYGLGTYNSSNVTFNGVQGDGSGQTIAIIDSGSDPTIATDLTAFDSYYGLPDPPSFQQLSQTGTTTLPAVNSGWITEISLDVEWSHVMAPKANIILFACTNLYTGAVYAAQDAGVSVVSMSFSVSGSTPDSDFVTPAGHTGVTFTASSGDTGAEVISPSQSPNVVSVGGTDLYLSGSQYGSETAWSDGGGGISTTESQPAYQKGIVSQFSTTQRTVPDVAMDADPGTGVAVYSATGGGASTPWELIIGGTSLASPLFAGVVAVADQGRVAAGLTPLAGSSQTLPRLYELSQANYSSNFHDITSGNNGHAAGTGYDLTTGLGSAKANNLIPDLAGADTISGRAYIDTNGNGTYDAGTDTPLASKTVYLDLNGNGAQDPTDPTTTTDANGLYTFTDVIGSFTGKVRLVGPAGYLPENNTTLTTAYNTAQTYDLIFASSTTYTATGTPATVTAKTAALGVTIAGTAAANLTYTWTASTVPYGAVPVYSVNGTAASQNTTVTFNMAGTYVFTVLISDGSGHVATSSVTIVVSQTLTSMTISPVNANLTGGSTQQMTGTTLDQFGFAMATQPSAFTWSITSGTGSINSSTGLYTAPTSGTLVTVKAVYSTVSATQQVYVVSSPWVSADIGSVATAGTAFDTGGVFNVSGGGAGITGTTDAFHYVYRALGGDGTIIARVASQSNSNASAGAGVMIRASLDPSSQEVSMGVTPTSGAVFASRNTYDVTLTSATATGIAAPYWVKLVRSGSLVTGYYSVDGTTWVQAGSVPVVMTGGLYIGMYDTGYSATAVSTDTFDNVSLIDAANDSITATANTPVTVSVLANDVGPTGSTLTVSSITQGSQGTVVLNANNTLTYTTTATAAGSDSFNYTMSDGLGDTATATVNVNITGLEVYYKMNEGTGSTTADVSGNFNTGTITKATWTTGVAGNGLAFNGSGQFVTVPVLNMNTNTVTFTGWVNSAATQTTGAGLIYNDDGTNGNGLNTYSGSTLGYSWGTSSEFNSGLKLTAGTWTFVALVITATNATVYMEPLGGTLTSASRTLANTVQPFSTPILIGEDSGSTSYAFNGSMDETRIYDQSLSLSAITALGKSSSFLTAVGNTVTASSNTPGTVNVLTNDSGPNGSTLSVTSFTQPSNGTVVSNGNGSFTYSTTSTIVGTDSFTYTISDGLGDTTTGTVNVTILGLLAFYKMDEGTGTATADATGNGYTGSLSNTTWATGSTGATADHALTFNGTSSDVTFNNSPSLSGNTDFTAGAWIKTTVTPLTNTGVVIEQRDDTTNGYLGEYKIEINSNGTVTFYVYNNSYQFDVTSTKTVSDGKWHQLTGIRSGTTGTLYIDGVQAATGSGTVLSLNGSIAVNLGTDIRSNDEFFNGSMDDVAIYDLALNPTQIANLSTLAPTIVTAAGASPSTTVTGTTTTLSVAAADAYENVGSLTYTWAATTVPAGAAAPGFSPNGTNLSNSTLATFTKPGTYVLQVTITSPEGEKITSNVTVTVVSTLTSIAVTPATASVYNALTTQLTTSAKDQFGVALATQPTFTWTVDNGGVGGVSSSGLYTAPPSGAGSATVRATSGAISGTSLVTVNLSVISGTSGDDVIRLALSNDGTNLLVYVNNASTPVYTVPFSTVAPGLTVSSSTGNDSVNVDDSNGYLPIPAGGLTIDGGSGNDSLILTGAAGTDTTAIGSSTVTFNGGLISYSAIESIIINGNGGTNTTTQNAQPGNSASLIVNGTTTGGPSMLDTLNINAGTFAFSAPATGGGLQSISLAALSIASGATVMLSTATAQTDRWVLATNSLTMSGPAAKLDLGGNDLLIHNTSAAAANATLTNITGLLTTGFANGAWNGYGIASSAAQASATHLMALGTMINNGIYSTFDKQPAYANDVIVKYTFYGDANLDGKVDGTDYSRIDAASVTPATGWFNGDFNYDGAINGSDYTLIDNAFNMQGTALLSAIVSTEATPAAALASQTIATAAAKKAKKTAAPVSFYGTNIPLLTGFDARKDKNKSEDVLDRLNDQS